MNQAAMSSPDIHIDDAQNYLQKVVTKLRAQNRADTEPLLAILEHIAQYIQVTKREISSLRVADGNESFFATASDELGEVVAESANATNEIMSAAEAIERLDPAQEGRDALNNAVTRIYLACGFQDITGQRIAKVIRTLKSVEAKIAALATACGGEVEQRMMGASGPPQDEESRLLNGPQLRGQAQSQDDIDKLFESAN